MKQICVVGTGYVGLVTGVLGWTAVAPREAAPTIPRAGGTAVVYVSHRLEEVFRLADEVTVSVTAGASAAQVDRVDVLIEAAP